MCDTEFPALWLSAQADNRKSGILNRESIFTRMRRKRGTEFVMSDEMRRLFILYQTSSSTCHSCRHLICIRNIKKRLVMYALHHVQSLVVGLEILLCTCIVLGRMYKYLRSNRKAMNRNWSNQKANPALKTKTGNK